MPHQQQGKFYRDNQQQNIGQCHRVIPSIAGVGWGWAQPLPPQRGGLSDPDGALFGGDFVVAGAADGDAKVCVVGVGAAHSAGGDPGTLVVDFGGGECATGQP
jgi:hypothetical protein